MQSLSSAQKKVVFFVFILAFLLRVVSIDKHSIWVDEKFSTLIANGLKSGDNADKRHTISLSEFKAENTAENVHAATVNDNGNSIVYNFLLHYWTKTFGNTDFSTRFLSLIFSMASLLVAFLFCLRNINYRTALIALILLSIQSLSIAFANETRTYSMTVLCTLCATWIFWESFVQKKSELTWTKVILYAILCALSILTHYLSAYIFIAHALLALIFIRDKKTWLLFTFSGTLALGAFGLWMLSGGAEGLKIMSFQNAAYVEMVKNYKEGDSTFVIPSTIFNMIIGICQVWLLEFGNGLQAFFRVREIAPLLLLPLGVIIYSFVYDKEKKKLLTYLAFIVVTQILFATYLAVNSGHTISFQPLYSIFASPCAMILFASGIVFLFEKYKKIAFVLLGTQLLVSCVSIFGVFNDLPKPRAENPYAAFATQLENDSSSNDTIVCPTIKDAQLLSLYLSPEKNYIFEMDSSFVDQVRLKNNNTLVLDLKDKRY
ncbi:MAG: glycosyltransferase family 39 protein [Bacteroidetes bacterium]|nr:glycosyltransferase family 39 protein [Bacteroidota bacterium]